MYESTDHRHNVTSSKTNIRPSKSRSAPNFKSESEFRSHLLSILPSAYRIEPGSGATSGLPDLFFYPLFAIPVFLELKHTPKFNGIPKFTKSQLMTIPKLIADGANVMTMASCSENGFIRAYNGIDMREHEPMLVRDIIDRVRERYV